MMGNIKGYFNPYPEELGNTVISRCPFLSISLLVNAVKENCQTKIKLKS